MPRAKTPDQLPFVFVVGPDPVEPIEKGGVRADLVKVASWLEDFNLSEDLELSPLFLEVDHRSFRVDVREGRVEHGEVGEEGAEVGHGAPDRGGRPRRLRIDGRDYCLMLAIFVYRLFRVN